jgi:hypothetical protein
VAETVETAAEVAETVETAAEVAETVGTAAEVAEVAATPRKACAALSLGEASPKPHPPSRSSAMMAPPHLPVLKPQQPEAQSASDVQTPVMNWVPVPWVRAGRETKGWLVRV